MICCQDYDEGWVLGNLEHQSVQEVLESEQYAQARRIVYGVWVPPPKSSSVTICAYASEALTVT